LRQCVTGIFDDRPISKDGGNDENRRRDDLAKRQGGTVGDCRRGCLPVGTGRAFRPQAEEPFDCGECNRLDCNHFFNPLGLLLRAPRRATLRGSPREAVAIDINPSLILAEISRSNILLSPGTVFGDRDF
jgi:hypothetical protein